MENQQFGDEHGLGLNDAGVESVEVIKGPASYYMVQMRWWFFILTLRNLQMRIPLKRT
jgi:hypothetical protein